MQTIGEFLVHIKKSYWLYQTVRIGSQQTDMLIEAVDKWIMKTATITTWYTENAVSEAVQEPAYIYLVSTTHACCLFSKRWGSNVCKCENLTPNIHILQLKTENSTISIENPGIKTWKFYNKNVKILQLKTENSKISIGNPGIKTWKFYNKIVKILH